MQEILKNVDYDCVTKKMKQWLKPYENLWKGQGGTDYKITYLNGFRWSKITLNNEQACSK